jgi:hypothetical protein
MGLWADGRVGGQHTMQLDLAGSTSSSTAVQHQRGHPPRSLPDGGRAAHGALAGAAHEPCGPASRSEVGEIENIRNYN